MKWDAIQYSQKHHFVTDYGNDVVSLLNPVKGEVILDLGCGGGDLTHKLKEAGCEVCGVDYSESMLSQAKKHFPDIDFIYHNAEKPFPFAHNHFDAVFSNAALHWMHDAKAVINNVFDILKPGGRFVFEMGGKGNIQTILSDVEKIAQSLDVVETKAFNYYPSLSEYSSLLEQNGFRVTYAIHFDRPTKLQGQEGLRNWVSVFREGLLQQIPQNQHEAFFNQLEKALRPTLYYDNTWHADYVRLRMVAIKCAD
ncbi:class I SAM-dependent methyltransferase [Facilibium subflavum]|uniref:class I SAM-dependent methyltransferase n=1 Tax=Facilibium subflavum TaxID=2219058 RepID=UPI000E64AD56|nr:class I SAM-dependent methyltransferase [Facilibium subflavum]